MMSTGKGVPGLKDRGRPLSLRFSRSILRSPARVSILGFAGLISLGSLLLALPQASRGDSIGWVNALFTATSATCVTGLVVVETGKAFTQFGQGVILVLIQVGGLGIMTLSTLFLLMAGRRPSLVGRIVIRDTLTHGEERSLASLLRDVLLFTLIMEAAGAALIFIRLLPGRRAIDALYMAVFDSISAFCNAGFSLFTDSFVAYRGDWVLNWVLICLIVSGGIGFLVLYELKRRRPFQRRGWSRMSLHSKLVISTTAILVTAGTLLILIMEWHNTLKGLSVPGRFLAALFQSATARTAGFNTLNIGGMANETLFVLIVLMFIGASPGSCGGGIKTTTFASLIVLALSRLRGQEKPQIFHRSIPEESISKAVGVVMISTVVIVAGTMALLMTELGEISHSASRGRFLELLFEVVSAFGTVGLTTGITQGLSDLGKLILTCIMFVGRLGPLVVAIAVSRRITSHYYYAEESIMIG